MALKASHLAAGTRTIAVKFDEGELSVTFRPNFYNMALEETLNAADTAATEQAKASAFRKFLPQFTSAVKAWDLTDDEGTVIPVTEDGVRNSGLGLATLAYIIRTCIDESTPDPQKPRA